MLDILNGNIVDLQLFAENDVTNVTTQDSMSVEMKTYYDTELLENARADLYFSQFGKKTPLPAGKGNEIEWRKWNTFDKALTPLEEGKNPTGQHFGATSIKAECAQYGTFTQISDKLELQTIDDVILGATEEMGASAGETMDTLIRNALMTGTNVYYAPNEDGTAVTSRADISKACPLTSKLINKIATKLKKAKAPKIDGKYVMIIHPSCSYDIRNDKEWIEAHKYSATTEIFNGEIGELHGIRFVENDNVKVVAPAKIIEGLNKLTVSAAVAKNATTVSVTETLESASGLNVPVYIGGQAAVITAITKTDTGASLTVSALAEAVAAGDIVCGQGAGKDGSAVYLNIAVGRDAYGVIDPEGAGLEMIIHDKASGGTSNPLNLYSTIGYKFMCGTKILYPERLIRVECGSEFSDADSEN